VSTTGLTDFFKADDFKDMGTRQDIANWCNQQLRERGVVVYGYQDVKPAGWCFTEHKDAIDEHYLDTHTALLISIKPLNKE
jgi:hypothetical protein